jgi:hypothetical protein
MALFVLFIGLAAAIAGLLLGRRVLEIRSWPTAEATVIERGVGPPPQATGGARRARFVPVLVVAYEVGGRRYTSTGRSAVQEAMTEAEARAWVDAVPDTPRVHVNPGKPEESYLEPGSLVPAGVALGLGVLALASGAILLLAAA